MHGHFSIIWGHVPGLPPKVYAFVLLCPTLKIKGASGIFHELNIDIVLSKLLNNNNRLFKSNM